MQKWHSEGKKVRTRTGQYVEPTNNYSYFCIENSVKEVILLAPLKLTKLPKDPEISIIGLLSSLAKEGLWS